MPGFIELLGAAKTDAEGRTNYQLYPDWMQGRAVYGGLSAALCLDGVLKQHDDLPPLRSATINFIGPGDDGVTVESKVLRRGKSVSFVQAELVSGSGLIAHTVFGFGAARQSRLDENFGDELYQSYSSAPSPEQCESYFPERESFCSEEEFILARSKLPPFQQYFEVRIARGIRPFTSCDETSFDLWIRHRDPAANDLQALLAIADMPPPAIMSALKKPSPMSSMSWMINLLEREPKSDSGWWLLGSYAEHAKDGYSSQNMTIHNDQGELVIVGRQNVAVFY